jgi:chemotaxis protein CheD
MSQVVKVGISDLNAVRAPDSLVTFALGSCVGICLYDSSKKIAGLSHIMLPNSTEIAGMKKEIYKFADTAIGALVKKMEMMGARSIYLKAKIAGGAQMFAGSGNSALSSIGQRNVAAVKAELARLRIPIIAEDTGKNYGRTLYFNAEDGSMRIKSVNRGEWVW